MAAQSRRRAAVPPLHPFKLGESTTPDEQTPRALPLDHPLASSSSADGDEEKDDDDDEDNDNVNGLESRYKLDSASSDESSDSTSNEDEDAAPFLHHSNSSLLMANAFAPPYYNKPPTPLPASPSLTSLLRPSFSTTTSRPTTPDSSEGDTPNDTEAAVAKSARTATTVPRASPKVPTYEYYGFVLYLLSSLFFLIYLLWSYLPSPFLHQFGIYYYPNRWWSLAIPSFLVMTIVYIYIALASYNTGYLTLPMSSIENIVDRAAHVAVIDSNGHIQRRGRQGGVAIGIEDAKEVDWKILWNEGTDAVMDVPVGGVCEILYG
ncbi:hypothetical protein N7G274_005653 [Stereocaulon virgatum]|uniref:PIG-P domain-containing protein n=1 Tax=Stereocaulon virgatum TaxID=373712 RepID=A0ABR4A9V3_9LECA